MPAVLMADITMDRASQINISSKGTNTDCYRQEALYILDGFSTRLGARDGWIRTYMRAIRCIENLLNGANGVFDIGKLCHRDFRRNARCEAKCSCSRFEQDIQKRRRSFYPRLRCPEYPPHR